MKILRAIGLAIGIIVLKVLMPEVFSAFEQALLSFFTGLQHTLSAISSSNLQGQVYDFTTPGF